MDTPLDFLAQAEAELAAADYDESATGVDRRQFMFFSLVAAAASTFGAQAAGAQGTMARASGISSLTGGASQPPQPPQVAPVALGNGEAPAMQFMPYPGGTGALMERVVREKGVAAFTRTPHAVEKWSGVVPTNPDDLAFLPAHRIAALIKARKITSRQITDIYLARIEKLNPTLNFVVTLLASQARAEADRADAEIAAGKYRGPLHGVPYGIKDLFAVKGVPTTWGSADFKDQIADIDSEVVVRLRDAGAVLLAKLATGLFAQNDWWFGGRTNNPWKRRDRSCPPRFATASAHCGPPTVG